VLHTQVDRQTDRHTDIHTDIHTYIQTDTHTTVAFIISNPIDLDLSDEIDPDPVQ